MDSLPELPGVALRSDGHVGVYIGGGYAVEERGFNYGCVKTRVSSRNWTHWYKLPFIDYGEGAANVPATEHTLGSRLLKKGMEGSDVKALQELLLQLGYDLPRYGADGEFGSETLEAVKAFQKDEGLEVDGKYGEKSHAALMDAVADADMDGSEQEGGDVGAPVEPEEPDAPDEPESPRPLGETVVSSRMAARSTSAMATARTMPASHLCSPAAPTPMSPPLPTAGTPSQSTARSAGCPGSIPSESDAASIPAHKAIQPGQNRVTVCPILFYLFTGNRLNSAGFCKSLLSVCYPFHGHKWLDKSAVLSDR